MQRVLVVYYSVTGHTRQLAEAIAASCHGDIDPIVEVTPRQDASSRRFWWGIEAVLGRSASIMAGTREAASYDVVAIGTPVWVGRMTPPVRAYINEQRRNIHALAVFCTGAEGKSDPVLQQMADLAGKAPIARLAVSEAELAGDGLGGKLAGFVEAVQREMRGAA